ncbi:MAG: acyltransferase [Treponema sp.]|jgi:1-acyl-sn-glycerol-3-phosphate acyltransferase|nr:acyltransferase [Treponema sp.]
MYKRYQKPVITASPDVKVPEPGISKFILFIVSIISKPYIYFLFGFARIVLKGDDILFDAFKRALAKESRCIIAFRHPDGREPQLLAWFFLFKLKALAAKKGLKFARNPHAIFVYGYEVARWGGPIARFFMPNIGAIPIHHTKMDSKGMKRIYKAVTDGPYPLALAPEGQVSYSTDTIPRLETGVIRIGFQAAQQLSQIPEEKEKKCDVEILPVSIHFRYDSFGKAAMNRLLKKIEKTCGFSREAEKFNFQKRLKMCRDYILEKNEIRYNIKKDDSLPFERRLENVTNSALETAERMLGIKAEGDFFTRLYKVRHDCWDRIFMPGINSFDSMTGIERNIMDLGAGEAWHIARHQELADFSWYFRRPVPAEETALHIKVEYVQNLWDFVSRTMGGAFKDRINIQPRKVIIQTASPVNISNCLSNYIKNKKSAVNDLVSELEKAYLDCIKEVNTGETERNY